MLILFILTPPSTCEQASRLIGPALRCLQITAGNDHARFAALSKGSSANAARKRALGSGLASASASASFNHSHALPLHENGVLEGLLLALHHLLQPKQPPLSSSSHSSGRSHFAEATNSNTGAAAAAGVGEEKEGGRTSTSSRPHRHGSAVASRTTHQPVQLHALALLSTLAAQYPTHLHEHWHLFLPVKSERNRTQRLIELRKHNRNTAATTAASQPVLSDAPLAAPLPTLILEPLEP